jgi:hypothetical protein
MLREAVNLAINEESGFLYATQARIEGPTSQVIVDLAFVDILDSAVCCPGVR